MTDIPIDPLKWERLLTSFYLLPGYIVKAATRKLTSITSLTRTYVDSSSREKLWMQIAMTSPQSHDDFALASTHFENAKLTLAIMIGCSMEQIRKVHRLIESAEDCITHPFLMLGICGELHLDRLKKLVSDRVTECNEIIRELERLQKKGHDAQKPIELKVVSSLIAKFRERRVKCKRAEEEVKTTKRQLFKALPPKLRTLLTSTEPSGDDNDNEIGPEDSTGESMNGSELEDTDTVVANMFAERFMDIFSHFEGLIADCRIGVEEMSSTAEEVSLSAI